MNKNKLEEDLIVDMGYTKYLKIPSQIKKHFGNPIPNVNPKSRFEEIADKIKITYIFKKLDFTKKKVKIKSKKSSKSRIDMGYTKYLKIPENVKNRFGNPISDVNPDWDFEEIDDKIKITYIFDKSDFTKVQKAKSKSESKKSPPKKKAKKKGTKDGKQ